MHRVMVLRGSAATDERDPFHATHDCTPTSAPYCVALAGPWCIYPEYHLQPVSVGAARNVHLIIAMRNLHEVARG